MSLFVQCTSGTHVDFSPLLVQNTSLQLLRVPLIRARTERGRSGVGAGSEQGKSEVSSAKYIADRLLLRVLLEGTKGES